MFNIKFICLKQMAELSVKRDLLFRKTTTILLLKTFNRQINSVAKRRVPKRTIPGINLFLKERNKEQNPYFFKGIG